MGFRNVKEAAPRDKLFLYSTECKDAPVQVVVLGSPIGLAYHESGKFDKIRCTIASGHCALCDASMPMKEVIRMNVAVIGSGGKPTVRIFEANIVHRKAFADLEEALDPKGDNPEILNKQVLEISRTGEGKDTRILVEVASDPNPTLLEIASGKKTMALHDLDLKGKARKASPQGRKVGGFDGDE